MRTARLRHAPVRPAVIGAYPAVLPSLGRHPVFFRFHSPFGCPAQLLRVCRRLQSPSSPVRGIPATHGAMDPAPLDRRRAARRATWPPRSQYRRLVGCVQRFALRPPFLCQPILITLAAAWTLVALRRPGDAEADSVDPNSGACPLSQAGAAFRPSIRCPAPWCLNALWTLLAPLPEKHGLYSRQVPDLPPARRREEAGLDFGRAWRGLYPPQAWTLVALAEARLSGLVS